MTKALRWFLFEWRCSHCGRNQVEMVGYYLWISVIFLPWAVLYAALTMLLGEHWGIMAACVASGFACAWYYDRGA